ncbi:MAG: hypothetical protein ACFFA0_07325 [Promethearchaeota archaeon]
MQNPEELAQEALKYLELAQKFEEEENVSEAILNYQAAADCLKQSGYLMHRIDEIYERVKELKDFTKQDRLYQHTQSQTQAKQLQDQAFALLEGAKKLESDGFFEDAIQQYISAINLLNQSGWSEIQLENLNLKIKDLSNTLKKEQSIRQKQDLELTPPEEFLQKIEDKKPEVVGMFGEKVSREKAETVARYRSRKKLEEETQNHAFSHIDKAKSFENERKFDKAISNYERAIELLNSIGWEDQTQNIKIIIEKLKKDKQQFEQFQTQQKQATVDMLKKTGREELSFKSQSEIRKAKLIELEEKKKREEEIQVSAFNLIDLGKRFEREKDYERAIRKYEQAIELFKSIEWDTYINPIIKLIGEIKVKQEREQKADQLREKRQKDITILQNSIYRKQEEKFQQSVKDLESRRQKFEEKRETEAKTEKDFFTILGNADNILQSKNYEEAINEYEKALKLIEELGPGWETYVSNIKNTISNVQKIKNSQLKKQHEAQQKIERREKEEFEFQKQIAIQLDKQRKQLKQKEILLKDKQKEIVYLEQRKNEAFESLDSAINYVKEGDYDNAILAYQNTGNIFAEIQWNDEISLIEKAIFQVEELHRNEKILKQKRMQETIKRQKEDEEFQNQISQYLKQERKKIKKREIELKEREEELKYREERREAGFKLLEQAQDEVRVGNLDKAIEILHYATNFFADAQWYNEISLIQESIIEIDNKKREVTLQEQIKLQSELDREKQEKAFQKLIAQEIKTRQEKLKKEEIIIREYEKEIAYREKKKEEAFKLLDDAQKLVSTNNYDAVLEIYYKVINIFAQIQWKEEIPILKEAIRDIEEKRREELIFKQKQLQIAINKEFEDKSFIETIRYQREREKQENLRDIEFKKQQKEISVQQLEKQEEAFRMIEGGEKFLQNQGYNEAIKNYQAAIKILKEIGWGTDYLKLLNETISTIQTKKSENEKAKQLEFELKLKHQNEEEQFQKKISGYLKREQDRIKTKQVQLQKREEKLNLMETRKLEAFSLMDEAEILLNQGQFDESIKQYRQVELILNEIGYPTVLIREMIQKIQEKSREEELTKLKELEIRYRKEQEDLVFQQQISERVRLEQEKMKQKQEKLKKQEEIRLLTEKKEENAFNILEKAQNNIRIGEYDKAISLYKEALDIFSEIHWDDEIRLIQNSIRAVENKKREIELKKQKALEEALEKERLEKEFQDQIALEISNQREKLKREEFVIRKRDKELAYREKQKEIAFKLLDEAQASLSEGKYNDSINIYNKVANIFAQIQWVDEIPIIQEAIKDIKKRKREKELLQQKELEKAIENEKDIYSFLEKIRIYKEQEKAIAVRESQSLEMQRKTSAQNLLKQQDAFKLIEEGDLALNQNNFDNALSKYNEAINILTEIGWTGGYLKLLNETIGLIKNRKRELIESEKLKQEILIKQKEEDEMLEKKISQSIQREKKRFTEKRIQVQKREDLLKLFEKRKLEAFDLMKKAEESLSKGLYEQATERYRQSELILYEIGFPTGAVNEMIDKIQEKNREEIKEKEKELDIKLQKEREEQLFQRRIAESVRINDLKMKIKQKELEKRREFYSYMEKKKDEAFELLEEAEIYMNQAQYDKSLDYYRSAEIILNEIAFPTEVIRETIQKVQEKKREYQLKKQKEIELTILKEREEWTIQNKLEEELKKETERLQLKQVQIEEMENLKAKLELRKQNAFEILDDAEEFLKKHEYEKAIERYRKAELILNELHFPTDSIKNMLVKVNQLIKHREEMQELEFQKELQKIQEEKDLQLLIEERQRQEREKKKAQLLAIQERERIIQEQKTIRESAYSMLEEAGKYLKQISPDYNKAISLYIQARNILSENIGWEPEINNLNGLIKDLQQEQVNFREKKRLEEQALIKRQKEYEVFQEEVNARRLEQEKLRREQERQYRELIISKRRIDEIKDEGLKLIDEGKKWAAYHDFKKAYQCFEEASEKFREIGWFEETKYIETEIKNTKILEEKVKIEESKIQTIQEQLDKQRELEESRRKTEEEKLKVTIGEVSNLADEVIKLIEDRRKEQEFSDIQKKEGIKYEAKEFRRIMGDMIKIKEELIKELRIKEAEKRDFQEKLQKAKEREEVDNLKRMIKEAEKKKKK